MIQLLKAPTEGHCKTEPLRNMDTWKCTFLVSVNVVFGNYEYVHQHEMQ